MLIMNYTLFLYFFKYPDLLKEPRYLFPEIILYCPVQCMFSVVFLFEALQKAIFDCQYLVSTCRISACQQLIISQNQMSVGQSSVGNLELTQFNLILSKTVVSTFLIFNVMFNKGQFDVFDGLHRALRICIYYPSFVELLHYQY